MATVTTTRRTILSLLSRTLSHQSPQISPRFGVALINQIPNFISGSTRIPTRFKATGSGYSPLNDPSPNWSNRPPKETILLDGCDYEHWLIVMEFTKEPKPTEDEMVEAYVKTLASVVGSVEEAKKKIYSVCTTTYTGFGALISEELSYKVKGLPDVLWVLPDSYLDVPNKDYGGDLFVDGKVIHRPQYRFTDRQPSRSRTPRVRYDRRRETMQTERREPMRRDNLAEDRREPVGQPTSVSNHNVPPSGNGGSAWNTGGSQSHMNNQGSTWNQGGSQGPMNGQSVPQRANGGSTWNQGGFQGPVNGQNVPQSANGGSTWNQGGFQGPMNGQSVQQSGELGSTRNQGKISRV